MGKRKIVLTTLIILCCVLCAAGYAKSKKKEIDISGFADSRHHWYVVYEENNIIDPSPNQPCYKPTQIKKIADNILLYQKNNGGWPKNYDMLAILTKEQKQKFIDAKNDTCTTFDNSTTFSQVEYLAQAYEITGRKKYKDACIRGIDFILKAQYPNGGWPQFFPLTDDYKRHITFNDDAMTGIMRTLKNMIDGQSQYAFLDSDRREKIRAAFDKGLDCIIKCQIYDNGRLTAWCQQHDENDFSPTLGRAYELPSICNGESSGVVLFLMSIDNPSKEVINAVNCAVKWFEDSKIPATRVDTIDAPRTQYPLRVSTTDRVAVHDPNAPPIWARFYELKTNRPLFADRRGKELYSLAEVDRERRSGYRYYVYLPQEVLDKYPAWKKKIGH
ncbi:MAG: pectate lyase [Sedimentisphaerales bacterium]|nr:pectate lyase [Sedimentisphaerales bacterium]